MKSYLMIALLCLPIALKAQIITTIAGNGASIFSGEGIPATLAQTPSPGGGAFDKHGNYYFCDGQNSNRVRKITPSGIITTVAGNGMGGFTGDGGSALLARLNGPAGVAVDTLGNLYIADLQNARIRKVDAFTGTITTIAGTGSGTYDLDDVPATMASIWGPQDVCLDKFGNLFIADGFNYRIRKVTPAGIISTYAGTGLVGYSGEGTDVDTSRLPFISGICSDTTGNIYIASNTISRVMKISTTGIINTVAGNGGATYAGDGIPATNAQFTPVKITINNIGDLFIADRYVSRIYKVDGSTGIFYNVSGTGIVGDSGDGTAATAATLNNPSGVALDACGNLYIPTVGSVSVIGSGRRIRKVTFNPPTTPTVTITGITSASVGATVTVNASVTGAGSSYSIKWFKNSTLFSTTTLPSTTYIKGTGTDEITAKVIPLNLNCYDSTTSLKHYVTTSSLGLDDVNMSHFSASIYPNPSQNMLTISAKSNINTVSICNSMGQSFSHLKMTKEDNHAEIDVASLPAGVYVVRVNGVYFQRFVKQ
jgi:hypothetical protein